MSGMGMGMVSVLEVMWQESIQGDISRVSGDESCPCQRGQQESRGRATPSRETRRVRKGGHWGVGKGAAQNSGQEKP